MADTNTAASLGAKLDALDLVADERALLTDLLTPADAEVSGYSMDSLAEIVMARTVATPRIGRPTFTRIMPGDNVDN